MTTLPKWPIKDQLFSHAYSSSNWFKPSYFIWDFNNQHSDFIFLTDRNVFDVQKYKDIRKYAWLVESPAVTPDSYNFVLNNSYLFDRIFSHTKDILQANNALLLPIGGCHLDSEEISLTHHKNKLISMMYSNKNFAPGHSLRHNIAYKYPDKVDIMGSGINGKHIKKIESCKNYCFSIAIENCRKDYYFTEKIIDCFLSGTIPIYWGCPSIEKFFNKNGFITFKDLNELDSIIKDTKYLENFYIDHIKEIFENYTRAQQYKIAEDYLYLNYKELI